MNPANTFNIETTVNQWLRTQIDAESLPSFFSGFADSERVIFNMPESPLLAPVFSATHLFIDTEDTWQGRRVDIGVGKRYFAFLDVSVWVSRSNANWAIDKRWMESILHDIVNKTLSIPLTEYLDDFPNTSAIDYSIKIDDIEARQTQQDKNPDLERVRFLIRYHTILRSNTA